MYRVLKRRDGHWELLEKHESGTPPVPSGPRMGILWLDDEGFIVGGQHRSDEVLMYQAYRRLQRINQARIEAARSCPADEIPDAPWSEMGDTVNETLAEKIAAEILDAPDLRRGHSDAHMEVAVLLAAEKIRRHLAERDAEVRAAFLGPMNWAIAEAVTDGDLDLQAALEKGRDKALALLEGTEHE